jgi:hypothetical protein
LVSSSEIGLKRPWRISQPFMLMGRQSASVFDKVSAAAAEATKVKGPTL